MKKMLCLLITVLLMASITACHKTQPTDSSPAYTTQADEPATESPSANTMTAYRADGSAVILEDCGDGTWKDSDGLLYYLGEDGVLRARGAEDLYTDVPVDTETNTAAPIGRQDGERFEAVIIIEGMEETVQYEHVMNEILGFEMDYEYESFVRHTESVCDRFTSLYDDPDDPQNYFEVSYSADDADTIAASVRESLSDDYDVFEDRYTLSRAGECILIDASIAKGGQGTPDSLQEVYIIPAADGCRIVTAHFNFEAAEGLGRRFSNMLNSLEIIDRNDEYEEPADYGEQPAVDTSQWTGRDYGELPPEDFEGWGDDGQNSTDNREWTGRDFGELPPEDFEGWGDDGQYPADTSQWTGRDYGELPPEDFFTGRDYGELPPEDFYTGADYGELPAEDFGG